MSKAQGQFTIIDYNDALTLTGYIGSNLAKTQMYNPDNGSYTPDWKTKNLVLTPSLYVIGTTADQIATANVTSVKWYVGDSNTAITAGTNYALSGAKSHILTVKANVMAELPGIDYRCVITYKDESTGLSLTHPLTISFSRVVNGSGIVDLLVTTPDGNVFKNEEVASLTAKAELWRGSTVDTPKVSYKWAVMDASVTATSSTATMQTSVSAGANSRIPPTNTPARQPIPSRSTPQRWAATLFSSAALRTRTPHPLPITRSFSMWRPSSTTPTRCRSSSPPRAAMCSRTVRERPC